jgi:hypothetical protein
MATKKKQEVEQVAVETKPIEPTFTKKQLMKSLRYAKNVDIIGGLLSEDKTYSIAEVDKVIEDFRKGNYTIK